MLKINLSNQAKKLFTRLTPKHQLQLAEKIQNRQGNPRPSDSRSVEGFKGCFRFEIDEYRVIFRTVSGVAVLLFATLGNWNNQQLCKLSLRRQS
jgi:mRNA-degrading endonuclease RelE of RelBE toxin-antitoxin system